MKKILLSIFLFLIISILLLWNIRPRPKALSKYEIHPTKEIASNELTVQFLGNTNLLFSDGETSILTDGFFSRPSPLKILSGKVSPNKKRINKCLEMATISKLDAVIPLHSHFDHAMDAPMVADITQAKLLGSLSTINIGKGYGLNDEQMAIPDLNSPINIGAFTLTFIASEHWQYPSAKQREKLLKQSIDKPLTTPASVFDYKEGISYTLLIEHDSTKIAVQGSSGFKENSISNFDADILFLSIAGLDVMDDEYNQNFHDYLIQPLQPEVIIPIHWDDFTIPLSKKPLKTPNLLFSIKMGTYLGKTFEEIESRNENDRAIKLLPLWNKVSLSELINN